MSFRVEDCDPDFPGASASGIFSRVVLRLSDLAHVALLSSADAPHVDGGHCAPSVAARTSRKIAIFGTNATEMCAVSQSVPEAFR